MESSDTSNKIITQINPTFILRGIDPAKVVSKYNEGLFETVTFPKEKVRLADTSIAVVPSYGTNAYSPIYSLKDKNSKPIIMATSNHVAFEVFTTSGGKPLMGGRCEWCREDFKHESCGVAVAHKKIVFTVFNGVGVLDPSDLGPFDYQDEKGIIYRDTNTFWTEGIFCDMECALAQAELYSRLPFYRQDVHYVDSLSLTRYLHRLLYPDSPPLTPAPDYRLLKSNGGSLTYEEYKNKRYTYKRTSNILLIPAKISYIRSDVLGI